MKDIRNFSVLCARNLLNRYSEGDCNIFALTKRYNVSSHRFSSHLQRFGPIPHTVLYCYHHGDQHTRSLGTRTSVSQIPWFLSVYQRRFQLILHVHHEDEISLPAFARNKHTVSYVSEGYTRMDDKRACFQSNDNSEVCTVWWRHKNILRRRLWVSVDYDWNS